MRNTEKSMYIPSLKRTISTTTSFKRRENIITRSCIVIILNLSFQRICDVNQENWHTIIAMLEACIGGICAGEEEVAGIGKRGDHGKGRNMLNKWAQ